VYYSEPDIDQRDPRWIGAWWLGFVICAATIGIWAFPLLLFPPKVAGTDSPAEADVQKNLLGNMKGLPHQYNISFHDVKEHSRHLFSPPNFLLGGLFLLLLFLLLFFNVLVV